MWPKIMAGVLGKVGPLESPVWWSRTFVWTFGSCRNSVKSASCRAGWHFSSLFREMEKVSLTRYESAFKKSGLPRKRRIINVDPRKFNEILDWVEIDVNTERWGCFVGASLALTSNWRNNSLQMTQKCQAKDELIKNNYSKTIQDSCALGTICPNEQSFVFLKTI